MSEQILNILVQAVLSILGVLASYLATVAIAYINKKKQAVIQQIGVDKYNETYNMAKSIYFILEQQFKFIPQAGELKKQEFDKLLLEKIPGLTQEEIDHFRESIAGQVNSQLTNTKLLAPAFNSDTDQADVKVN